MKHGRKWYLAAAMGVLLTIAGPQAVNAQFLVAVEDTQNTLLRIDPTTLVVSTIGPLGTDVNFGDLAFDRATQTLYMLGGRPNPSLYTVNLTTGAATLVGTHGINDLFGLAFDSSTGTLYATQFSGGVGLYTLNKTTGAATFIGNTSVEIGGLDYRPDTNQLLGINDGPGNIYSIDRATAGLTLLGNGGGVNDSDIAFAADTGFLYDADYSGNLFRYNPAAAFARTTLLTGLGSLDGLAYILPSGGPGPNVPEPSSLTLLGSLTVAGTCVFLRRRRV